MPAAAFGGGGTEAGDMLSLPLPPPPLPPTPVSRPLPDQEQVPPPPQPHAMLPPPPLLTAQQQQQQDDLKQQPYVAGGPGFAPMETGGTYPRVAHRHLYLWIERKVQERGMEAARRVKTIASLEAFYAEVAKANEGNFYYSPSKLRELVAKAPPYSLL